MTRLRGFLYRPLNFSAFSFLLGALALLPVQSDQPSTPAQQSARAGATAAPAVTRMQFCGLWRVDGSFRSTILVNNVLVTQPITVQPTLFMANGARYDLPPVKIAPGGVEQISVNDALVSAPATLGPHLSDYGTAAVSFSWAWDSAVAADMQVLNEPESLVYRFPFNSVSSDVAAPHVLEGLWWKRDPGVGGFVALANASEQALEVSVQVTGSRGAALPADSLTLPAHATEMLDLGKILAGLPAPEANEGEIRVEYNGKQGEVIVSAGLAEVEKGYSATVPVYPHDPDNTAPSTVSHASTGIMAGRPDPGMGFPKATRFTPYAVVRNTTAAAVAVSPVVYYTSSGEPASFALPDLELAPQEASEIGLAAALAQRGLADYSGMVTLVLAFRGHPDDLLEAAGSVDQTGTYVFEVTPHVVAAGGAKHAPFWDVAGGNDTMFTVWNPSATPEEIVATFLFAGGSGRYRLPLHLAGHASQSIDVARLIAAEQPDAQRNLIPPSVERGSVEFSGPGGLSEPISLAIEGGIFNVRTATCGCGTCCIICVGLSSCALSPNPVDVAVGSSAQATATASYSNGTTSDATSRASWSSNATSVATVETSGQTNPGLVTGVSPGSATVTADDPGFESGKACGTNPECTIVIRTCSSPTSVLQVSQSPSQFNMSTGDTKQITVSVSPGNVTVSTSFSSALSQNPDSSCAVSLSVPGQSGQGSITSNATASPAGCSGEFRATASANGVQSGNSTTVDTPPQVLIQMMQAEAGGTGNSAAMQSLGDVAQNRDHSSIFDPPYSNYQNTVVSSQFAIGSATTGIEPELDLSVNVFLGAPGRFCNALAFWTPTSTQWQTVQAAISSGSATFPSGTGAPTFSSWPTQNQQILYVSSVGAQGNGAPNFLFLASRPSTQPAAASASCAP